MNPIQVRIRIVHEEFKQLLATVAECRQESYLDVVYCWTKLVAAHAFRHVAQCECRQFQNQHSKLALYFISYIC